MYSIRLANTVPCPQCCFAVKPFVLRGDAEGADVECPRKECEYRWAIDARGLSDWAYETGERP